MTYKEKISKLKPGRIEDESWGGMYGCPPDGEGEKCLKKIPTRQHCEECWNREVPHE